MRDGVGPKRQHGVAHGDGVAKVDAPERGGVRHVLALAGAEIVDHEHFRTRAEERGGDVTADESRAAGDENLHGTGSLAQYWRRPRRSAAKSGTSASRVRIFSR